MGSRSGPTLLSDMREPSSCAPQRRCVAPTRFHLSTGVTATLCVLNCSSLGASVLLAQISVAWCDSLATLPGVGSVNSRIPPGTPLLHRVSFGQQPDSARLVVTQWGTHRDAVTVTLSAGGRDWYCGMRSTGWGLRADREAVPQWNAVQRLLNQGQLLRTDAAARALAVVFLNFATGWPIESSSAHDSISMAQGQADAVLPARLALSTAAYRSGATWLVNGFIETREVFEIELDDAGHVLRFRLNPR